jgi:hypothetical protein
MERRRRFDPTVVAWCLAAGGAITLMVSTVEPTSFPQLLIIGCALAGLGALIYGLSRLWTRRHGP